MRDDDPQRPAVVSSAGAPSSLAVDPAASAAATDSAQTALPLGTVLAGRYRLIRFIAEGGMGAVFEAQDLELGSSVAVKTIRPEVAGNPRILERFKREILLARRVTHPNVCRLFDFGRHQGTAGQAEVDFLTMELLDGETLVDLLAYRGHLTAAQALPLVRQMAAALASAHRVGIVHRDFKSGNVILVPEPDAAPGSDPWTWRAVVTDFGLARSLESGAGDDPSSSTATGTVVGTPAYLAPEQVAGEEATAASDQYALGVVMYEMVTGVPPFHGGDPLQVLVRRLRERAPSPRAWVPELDARWEAVILRCLEREPSKRYQSVEAMLADLEGETDVSAPPPSSAPASARWGRWLSMAGAAVAVIGLLSLVALRRERVLAARDVTAPRVTAVSQLTHGAAVEMFPSFAPDGRRLAFASGRSGAFAVYLRELESGVERALTVDADECLEPAFSPSGQWIAYHCMGSGGIWLQPAAGGPARQLSAFGSRPAWSPDSERVAFQSEPAVDLASNAVAAMPPSTLWVVGLGGDPPRAVTAAGSPSGGHGAPAFSADGGRLLFVTADRRTAALWSVSLDGGELVRLVDKHTYIYDPIASPDGRFVYYAALGESGRFGLFALPVAPATGRALAPPALLSDLQSTIPRHPTISRDGRRLAYAGLTMGSSLMSIAAEQPPTAGGPPAAARTTADDRNSRPVFSPDGRHLVFEHFRPGVNSDLWLVAATGGGAAERLTDQPTQDTVASWLPDSQGLAFRSDRLGRPAVWQLDLSTRAMRLLYDPHQDFDWARLSPDGRQLAMNSRSGSSAINVWLADLPNGRPRQLTFDSQSMSFPCWSPDGRTLGIEIKRGDDAHIGIVDVATGVVTQLTDQPGQAWPYAFAPDGDRIAFAGLRDGHWNIYWVSRSTREETQLTSYDRLDGYVRYPAWSPDGREIVFEQAETRGNIWQLALEP
jgi:Tol biopolymer transport system component